MSLMPNLPTPEGTECGRELARLARPEIEKAGVTPCDECAFVEGTFPNQCPSTVLLAISESAKSDGEFYCHKGVDPDEEPTRLCRGFVACKVKPAAVQPPKGEA